MVFVYGFTWLIASLAGLMPRRRWKPTGRILVTGTFHNPNWYLSHITPLARSGVKEVILVIDSPQMPIENVRFVCPPKWIAKLLSRAGAKAIWMIIAGIRYKPDLYMGYHLAPGACSALAAGKIMGRPACYQMTAGPVEIIGGGINALESVGGALGSPSKLIETMAMNIAKKFELIVVRGNKAKDYLTAKNIRGSIAVITGSVNGSLQSVQNNRNIHLAFVGRLTPIKQVDQFIKIAAKITREIPDIRAVIAGDGPLLEDMRKYAEELKIADNIEFSGKKNNIEEILIRTKIFILTSKTEGMSIALAEAMAAGVVPVVADVGELSDLVIDGVNGFLVEPDNIDEYTRKIVSLLQDESLWIQCSNQARAAAVKYCDIEVVTKKWQSNLQDVISQASGNSMQESLN